MAPLVGLQDQADRIRPVARRLPIGVRDSRTLVPQRFAHRLELGSRAVCH